MTDSAFDLDAVLAEALNSTHPDFAAEWHPTRNRDKTPTAFTLGSKFEAWWQCPDYKAHGRRSRLRNVQSSPCPGLVARVALGRARRTPAAYGLGTPVRPARRNRSAAKDSPA